MLFRKFLVRVRKEYNTEGRRLYILSALAVVVLLGISIICDILLPFNGWGNIIRCLVLLPTSVSLFVLGYAVSLFFHYARMEGDPSWVPYRSRLSPTWRNRIAAIIAAFLVVGIYANGFRPGYTFIASLFVAIGIGLFAFIRTTREEAKREELGVPDVRDTRFNENMRYLSERREQVKNDKEDKRRRRRAKIIGKMEKE